MKLILIFGPQAVGKMTVGQELATLTGLKLFHNHMTIDLVSPIFDYSTKEAKRLVSLFRFRCPSIFLLITYTIYVKVSYYFI
ncbi:hypothetical protein ACS94_05390 [Bacillus cereus]|uniref:Shikimate kinase n=2 Tax=Bacillus cereus TaxID=1396 RepID=A0A9X8J2D2_BACCE|nr:AAA family ATPase [Bacillus cereus]EEK89002.1 hypothetical protein bcere0011_26180 [Bacillus cereus m1550]MDR4286723.1 hypothetical protein [Bacillus thuringiensis]MEB4842247.1 AAA family ATPase [Paenibacillus jamilae]HCX48297.1 hypothetical protein [Bacillus sp. (in: firmicutes)]ASI83880.1 hypothetical protein FORC48_2795 [Bacillus cereus]